MKPYENKLEIFRLIALSIVFWVQWKIKEWHLSFLSPRSKLLKKNRGRLKDKDGIKCFFDIPYTVLDIGGAWKLFNEIHVNTQCVSGGLHMREDLRWNKLLQYSKHPCLEKWNKHGNKCSRSSFSFQERGGLGQLHKKVDGVSKFKKGLVRR